MSVFPSRSDENAISEPSGDQVGAKPSPANSLTAKAVEGCGDGIGVGVGSGVGVLVGEGTGVDVGFGVLVGDDAAVGETSGVTVSLAIGFAVKTLVAFTATVGHPDWVATGPSSVHAKTTEVAAARATANPIVVVRKV